MVVEAWRRWQRPAAGREHGGVLDVCITAAAERRWHRPAPSQYYYLSLLAGAAGMHLRHRCCQTRRTEAHTSVPGAVVLAAALARSSGR
jgi:hypothetical protein